jgi:hypothetical protein
LAPAPAAATSAGAIPRQVGGHRRAGSRARGTASVLERSLRQDGGRRPSGLDAQRLRPGARVPHIGIPALPPLPLFEARRTKYVAATSEQQCRIFDFGHLRTVFRVQVGINDGATPTRPAIAPPRRRLRRADKRQISDSQHGRRFASVKTVHTPRTREVQLTSRHTEPRPSCMAQAGSTRSLPNQRGL